ncbi:MAG: RluA family pseudouridine synthase [Pseudomonadota bacterium]
MSDNEDRAEEKDFIVPSGDIGTRMDTFIAGQMPSHVSRSRVKDLIKQGAVQLNGVICETPNLRVRENDTISLCVPQPTNAEPKPENILLDIIFEDDHLLVLNKPVGMVVHPAAGNWTGTLVNALLYHCGDSLTGIGGVKRPGIVHRLDKDTSGLLVVAKTEEAHASLTAQFMDHGKTGSLRRSYYAFVWNRLVRKKGTVDAPLARSNSNRLKQAVVNPDQGRVAVTHYQVKTEYIFDDAKTNIISLVECQLETGRTHQIRVHMSHIGHPLLGDQTYGKHFESKRFTLPEAAKNAVSHLKRQALHAAMLGFDHPESREYMEFSAPLPTDLIELEENISKNSL